MTTALTALESQRSHLASAESLLALICEEGNKWNFNTMSEEVSNGIIRSIASMIQKLGCRVTLRFHKDGRLSFVIEKIRAKKQQFIFQESFGRSFRRVLEHRVSAYARRTAASIVIPILCDAIALTRSPAVSLERGVVPPL